MNENMNGDGALTRDEVVRRSVFGATNSLVIRTISAAMKFVRTILLARLLSPEQFGEVGFALVFVQFLDTVGTFGLNMQLVRAEKLSDETVSTHFWLRMALQLVMVFLTVVLVIVFTVVYPERILLPGITMALGLIWFVQASYSTQEAVLAHQVNFQRTIVLELVSSSVSLAIAPLLAWMGWEVWSLVIGIYLVNALIFFIGLNLYRMPWRPSLKFDRALAGENLRFGWTVVVGKQLTYALDQFDDFWAGLALGNRALGFYERAFQFARYPRQVIAEPLSGVFFSTYAKFQNDPSLLSRSFFISNSLIIRMNGLFSLILFVIAPEFVSQFLGKQWLPMVFTFQLMIIYSFLDPLLLSAGNLLIAVGQPGLLTRNRFIQLVFFIPLVIGLSDQYGIEGIGVAADVMLLVGVIGLLKLARKYVHYSTWKMFLPPLLGLALGASAGFVSPALIGPANPWVLMILKGGVASAVYSVTLVLLERKVYRRMATELRTILPDSYARVIGRIFREVVR